MQSEIKQYRQEQLAMQTCCAEEKVLIDIKEALNKKGISICQDTLAVSIEKSKQNIITLYFDPPLKEVYEFLKKNLKHHIFTDQNPLHPHPVSVIQLSADEKKFLEEIENLEWKTYKREIVLKKQLINKDDDKESLIEADKPESSNNKHNKFFIVFFYWVLGIQLQEVLCR